jgi:ParB family chromosome partitioning protein
MTAHDLDDNFKNKKLKPKDRGLGRGLDALFGDEEDVYPDYEIDDNLESDIIRKTVGIEKLYPCPTQPRQYFDEAALKELAASIKEHGLIQPIFVRPDRDNKGHYEIVAGERRWRASQRAQLHEVPVVIRDLDDEAMFQIALVENLQRKDLSAIEEARGYKRLFEEFDKSHEDIGKVLGRSRSHVANMIRLLELPNAVQTMVDVGDITMGHARALIGCDDAFDLALHVIENSLSVRETEKFVAENQGRHIKNRGTSKGRTGTAGFNKKDADTLALEKEVSDTLGMNVTIDMKDTHNGKMAINFKTLDQLDDVLQRLAQTPKKGF